MTKTCVACGSELSAEPRYKKWGFPIQECSHCGLGATDVPADFDPRNIYDAKYFTGGHPDSYADYLGSESVLRKEFQGTLNDLRRHVPSGKLLEIGTAYGFFLSEASAHFSAQGVEISEAAAKHCKQQGLNVTCAPFDEKVAPKAPEFDAVVMLDVIEHLPDPKQAINLISKSLRPGGTLMLTTGDYGSVFSRLTKQNWRLLTPPQHLFFFTKKSLKQLLSNAGLDVVSIRYPWKFVPVSLILFQLSRLLGISLPQFKGLSRLAVPVNLFDAFQIVAKKRAS